MQRLLFILLISFLLFSSLSLADTITLYPGWNMFSTVLKTLTVDQIKTQCGTTNPPLFYNTTSKRFQQASSIIPGRGYWIYLTSSCILNLDTGITVSDIPDIVTGWNQIGGPSTSVIFDNVKGNCNFAGPPLRYNATTRRYNTSNTLDPGYGYWVYASGDCKLSSSTTTCTSCGDWTNGTCGGGTCLSSLRQQTRTCIPTGCTPTDGYGLTKCFVDSSCGTTTCDSTCKSAGYNSGSCKSSNNLPTPVQFNLINNPLDSTYHNYFHTHNTLITMFKTLFDKYPGYASYEPIGKTYEGRDIVLFKIGNPNGGKILWNGAIHGWEDAGSEIEYLISKWLLEDGTKGIDQKAQRILERNLILFVPVVNMDSYERQNRDFGTCQYGIDLNRNFVKGWTQTACGDYPNCYHGDHSASEPETQALRNAFQNYKPKFYIDIHYGGGPILYYYGGSGSNTTLSNLIIQRISQLSSQAGVTPYPTGQVGSGGETVGDASDYSNAWLLEVAGDNASCSCYSHTCHTLNDIANIYYPKVLPIFLAMTEASEVTPTPSCQTGETYIGQDGCSSGSLCCCKQTITCTSCGSWINATCGGSCASNMMQQARTCTPTGCTPSDGKGYSQCVANPSCGSAQFQVSIDSSKVIAKNNFSIGFMTDWSWPSFVSDSVRRQLTDDANFKLVRVFDFRTTSPKLMPCNSWNTATNNCTSWNWTQVDLFTQKVFEIGAEPLFTLGYIRDNIQNYIPFGMPINSTTGLPNLASYAVYASEWVKHFKQKGWPVRYYEIGNEPFAYFGWNPSPSNNLKLTYYVDLWNFVARAMRQQNPDILLSQDAITQTNVFNYWLQHGDDVNYLDLHKYDCGTWNKSSSSYYSDGKLFGLAESSHYETGGSFYGVKDSQQRWLTSRGKLLPVINSEGNLNSAWENGTDVRIQQMVGAVWKALELRKAILSGVSYSVYYEFSSSSSTNAQSGGHGFGMINSYNNQPWYPYYVQKWVGNNLGLGDNLIQSSSSSSNIRTLSWINNGKLNILLIHNSTATETVSLNGVTGQLSYQKIDDPSGTSYLTNAVVQTGTISTGSIITLSGYTVMLLQQTTSNQCTSCGGWINGTCGAGSCSSTQRQQTRTCSPTGCTPSDGLGLTKCFGDSVCGAQTNIQVKGIQWFYSSGASAYSSSAATQALNDLNSSIPHFNYVYLDVWVQNASLDRTTVVRDGKDNEYISAIQKARALGKKVVIRVRHRPSPYDFQPANTDLWLKNFTKAVVDWASFSQQYGVEMFSVVNEFNRWDGNAYSSYWTSLISQVKNVYSGAVIANINHWDKSQAQFDQKYSATWLKSLDYIAVSAYWDLCSGGGGTSVDQLVNSWQPYVNGLKNISDTHEKKIIIITGLSSANNTTVPTCAAPWDGNPKHWQQPDLIGQDTWYEAVFRVFNDKPWIYGYMFDTAWFTYRISSPTTNKEGTVQGKPAAATIEKWFSGSYIPEVKIKKMIFEHWNYTPQFYSEKADMYMSHFEKGQKVGQIHALDPNLITLIYRNIRSVYDYASEYSMFVSNGWILKNSSGLPVKSTVFNYYIVDIGNPAYQQWVANWMKNYTDQYGYNGVFLDNCLPSTEIFWSTTGTAINPRTNNPWTNDEVKQAVISIVNKTKENIGSKLVVGNGILHGERFFDTSRQQGYVDLLTKSKIDGIESEAWIMDTETYQWYSETKWNKSINFVTWLEDNFLNRGSSKVFLPVAQNIEPYDGGGIKLPTGTSKEQYALYTYASLALAASSNKNYLNYGYYIDSFLDTLFNVNIGNPLGKNYMISGTHVYARDFTNGKVLVNPTSTSYTINLGGNYKNLIGQTVSSITLNAHTGEILLKDTNACTSCNNWVNGACGGSCTSNQRQQTRTCNPTGCTPSDGKGYSQCIGDSSCGGTASLITGINYLSNGNRWAESNTTLDNDFSRFSKDGIKHISIRIMWLVMEPTHSDTSTNLDSTALNNIKRVLNEADKYGIKVNLDFWTQHGYTLGLPTWVGSYWDIEAIPEIRDHYVRYIQTVVNQLKSYPAIESWTVLNEPWFGTASNGQSAGKTEFQTTFPILYNAIKSIDPNRIVACRFALSYTPSSGKYDASVYNIFDVFPVTMYNRPDQRVSDPDCPGYNSHWSMYSKTVSDLRAINKPFWIIEFGAASNESCYQGITVTDSIQQSHYRDILAIYNNDSVDRAYAWVWQTGNAASAEFNIYNGTSPRPAYYELTKYGSPTTCSCGSWTNSTSCGTGGCSSTQRQQTRTCSPTGCTPSDGKGYSQCIADPSCGTTVTTKYNGLTIALDTLTSSDTPTVIINFMKQYRYNALRIYVGWGSSFWTGNINDPMNQNTKNFIDELCRLCAQNNFMVVSAVSDQLEPWKTFAHEEIQVGPNGEENTQGNWVCPTGPKFQTFEKNLIKTLVGIMEKYATPRVSVDEIVFVTGGGKPTFYCQSMKDAYKQSTGKDIPIFSSTSGSYTTEQKQFINFANSTIRKFFETMEDAAKTENSSTMFGSLVDTYWALPSTCDDTQPYDYYATMDEVAYEWFYAIQNQNWAGITSGLKRIKTLNPSAKHYFVYGTSTMTTINNMRNSVNLTMNEGYDGVFLYEYAKSKSNPFDVSDLVFGATCSCSGWTNSTCGGGGCASNMRQQTRTCSPSGCLPSDGQGTSRCAADTACGSSIPTYSLPSVPSDTWDGWRSRTEKENQWKNLWNAVGLSSKIIVAGKSVENRNVYLFEAGNSSAPTLLIDSQLHGNEDHAYEILTMFAYWLLGSGDPTAQNILQKNRVLFMPIVDTDNSDKLPNFLRCNANTVNLNRNFVSGFGGNGNNDPTDCMNYWGPSAASEPETQTVKNVFSNYHPRVYVNLHTGAFMASAYGNSTLSNRIMQNAPSFTSYFNAKNSGNGGGGMAVGDAVTDSPGCNAWLIEFFRTDINDVEYHAWRHDATNLDIIQNRYYPLFKEFMTSALQSIQ